MFRSPALPKWLLGMFAVWFGAWAIKPPHLNDFFLEQIYELAKWGVAIVVGGDVGQTYVGTQGDEWDAQKDMALATLGGLIAMSVTAFVNWRYGRDFVGDLTGGRGPDARPLGEVRLADMKRRRARN